MVSIGILGGGLTGLTIANSLTCAFEVLEKKSECGGLCKSMQQDGFTFDYGGAHIIFSRNREPINFMLGMLGENYVRRRRNNKIFFKGRLVKYPFENGLSDLPKEDCFECLYHYIRNDYGRPSNFKEWLYYTFGKGIAEKYLIPYNEKIWNYDAERMSLHWVEGRIPKPPLEDVIKSAIGIETEGYTHQLYFYYPKIGGIQALIKAMENGVSSKICKNFEISRVERRNDKWMVSNGKEERAFDQLISTIPIFDLIGAMDKVPKTVLKALNGLKYNSLISVSLGIDMPELNDITAMYFPDKDFYPHRVGFPMNFSKHNVPRGKSSLIAEITANEGDGVWELDDNHIIQHVIDGLYQKGIISQKAVCFSKVMRSKYAYVVYDLEYLEHIRAIRNYLTELGIILCGRFAEFEYLNMDACVERGIELAEHLNGKFGRMR
jgi:protoporphyrinogen oxidase